MASSYSPLLRLELIGSGEQSGLWGETTNKNLGTLIEQAIAGVSTISLSGGAGVVTLSALNGTQDQARSAVLKFIGNPSGEKTIEIPAVEKLYVARNDSGQKIIFKTAAQVANPGLGGVELLDGEASLVFCDGAVAQAGIQTVGVGTLTVPGGGTGATSFTGGFVKSPGGTGNLTSSATVNAASEVSGILPAANGGTGRNTMTAGRLLVGDGTNPVGLLGGSAVGQVATWNGSQWVAQTPASGGVTSFNGRTGAVSPQSGDYSSFYPSNTGSGASGTWAINISGSSASTSFATSAGTATSAGQWTTSRNFTIGNTTRSVNGTSAVSWSLADIGAAPVSTTVTTNTGQTITGAKTFTGGMTSQSYNFAITTSTFFLNNNIDWTILGNPRMSLRSNGNLDIAGAYGQLSDRRLKDNITDYTQGLETLNQVKVRSWTFNGKGGTTQGREGVGVVADEVETVLPGMVRTSEWRLNPEDTEPTMLKTVSSDNMLWLAVKAIQELSAKVDSLEAELAALK